MDKINAVILTPIKTGAIIPPADLGFDRIFSECDIVSSLREENINVNRAKLQNIYSKYYSGKYEYVYLIDSDVVVTKDSLIKLANSWKGLGTTACINTKGETKSSHIVCSCCFLHGTDYVKVNYLEKANECQCCKLPNTYYVDGLSGTEIEYRRF